MKDYGKLAPKGHSDIIDGIKTEYTIEGKAIKVSKESSLKTNNLIQKMIDKDN